MRRLYTFPLVTDKVEKDRVPLQKAAPAGARVLERPPPQLAAYIAEQKDKLRTNQPEELRHLRTNLFVNPEQAAVVEANLLETANALDSLALQVDKIRFMYEKISS
jgi:MoxR-like ATPase